MVTFNREMECNYDKQQLQSQYSILKKNYSVFKKLIENSGFGYDDVRKIPTAPSEVWDAYIAAHPDAENLGKKL